MRSTFQNLWVKLAKTPVRFSYKIYCTFNFPAPIQEINYILKCNTLFIIIIRRRILNFFYRKDQSRAKIMSFFSIPTLFLEFFLHFTQLQKISLTLSVFPGNMQDKLIEGNKAQTQSFSNIKKNQCPRGSFNFFSFN